MKVELEITVVAPDDQLKEAGETYAHLYRTVELPYAPFSGLRIGVPSDLDSADPRAARYRELLEQVSNPTAIFEIRHVYFYATRQGRGAHTSLEASEAYEPSIERWNAYIQFLCEFHGFERR